MIASFSEVFSVENMQGDLLYRGLYGHIDLMITNPEPLNMMDELFMDTLRESVIYCVPVGSHDRAANALRTAIVGEDKFAALETLIKVCAIESNFPEGLSAVERLINDLGMTAYRSRLLFLAGEMSMGLYDFDAAIGHYCRGLLCAVQLEDMHPTILTNLGFCWLYKRDFKKAEQCCRQAIRFKSCSWEAWKNLGVSLEHQCQIEEAFFMYLKAVALSRGRVVPVMHLVRLGRRHPGTLPDVSDLAPAVYREYEVIL